MKHASLFLLAVALVGGIVTQIARAEEKASMTEAHIAVIRANCVEAQTILSQLHVSDALLRVNRGQLYESILTKLITPFNSRVALNKYDGVNLLQLAATYERQLATFRSSYQRYDEALSNTLKINCTDQPVGFYDSVSDARAKRSEVHDAAVALQKTIQDYKTEFEIFAGKIQENKL